MVQRLISKFRCSQGGASAVEYTLLIGLLALAVVGGIAAIGDTTSGHFNSVNEGFPDA